MGQSSASSKPKWCHLWCFLASYLGSPRWPVTTGHSRTGRSITQQSCEQWSVHQGCPKWGKMLFQTPMMAQQHLCFILRLLKCWWPNSRKECIHDRLYIFISLYALIVSLKLWDIRWINWPFRKVCWHDVHMTTGYMSSHILDLMIGNSRLRSVRKLKIIHMGVSKNRATPQSSLLIGFSMINHPFWSTPIFGNTYIVDITFLWFFSLILSNLCKGYPSIGIKGSRQETFISNPASGFQSFLWMVVSNTHPRINMDTQKGWFGKCISFQIW